MTAQDKKVICPSCGEETVPQRRVITPLDGNFSVKREEFHCLFCGGLLPGKVENTTARVDNSPNKSSLKELLGISGDEPRKTVISVQDCEKRFCRDCKFYVAHPFLSRCDRHKCAADPMGDCPDFIRRDVNKESK